MDTLTIPRKTLKDSFSKTFAESANVNFKTENSHSIVAMTKGWQCCECNEEMYRDEDYCNWNRCNHRRCNSCRNFQV